MHGSASASVANAPCGALEGTRQGGVCAWLGIPYAQAPNRERRFREPEALAPWQGVRAATDFGPAPMQRPRFVKGLGSHLDEDSLLLNVWSPAPDDKKRPVLVFIHGGAFIAGSAKMYHGAHLAAGGDVVVVTLNYRLGVFGFVNFRDVLGDERFATNAGLRDQLLALRWVRDNIAAFGGDPARVTVAGESAGSLAVSLLMHAPAAEGLFAGAIMQSGALSLIHDQERSCEVASMYFDALGMRAPSFEQLQALDARVLYKAQAAVEARLPITVPAAPWYDDQLLPASYQAAKHAPRMQVPLLAGFCREEIRLFEIDPSIASLPRSRAELLGLVEQQLGAAALARIARMYPDTKAGLRQLGTDLNFALPTLHFAERHAGHSPTYLYRFDYRHPYAGASHGLELLFVWQMPGLIGAVMRGGPLIGKRRALAERMRQHWLEFVKRGRPGDDWPAFELPRRATKLFDLADRVAEDTERERRLVWEGCDAGSGLSTKPLAPAAAEARSADVR